MKQDPDVILFDIAHGKWTGVRKLPYGLLKTEVEGKDVARVWANVYGRSPEEYDYTVHGMPTATELLTRMLDKLEKL